MRLPEPPASIPATSIPDLDKAVAELRSHADRWAAADIGTRLRLLDTVREGYFRVAEDQVRAACAAKRIPFDEPVSAEEWLGGPMTVLRNVRLLTESLKEIQANGHPNLLPEKILPNGQRAVKVFPNSLKDTLLFQGFEGWVWLQKGEEKGALTDHMAEHYRHPPAHGRVSLVLGAGNVASIATMDALYKLFVEKEVVILKMNPVNEYLGPFIEKAMKAFIDEGFLRVVYGGAAVGSHLCYHEGVDDIHITGSDITHDIIVWGPPGPERESRKTRNEPLLKKPITSELGNVSPVMIVPGQFTEVELESMAENVATQLTNNGGFNCNAAKVLLTSKGWSQRGRFMDLLKGVLASIPPRPAYYPGAAQRHATWTEGHDHVDMIGPRVEGTLPWAIIHDVDCADEHQRCFTSEAFCGIMADTTLAPSDPGEFLREAVNFSNNKLFGTLSCTIMVDPRMEKSPTFAPVLEQAITDLKYGAVVINHWAAIAYGLVVTPWGGHSGATLDNVQSGIGWAHNSVMLDKPQKSVIRGPLVVKPKPPWFRTHRNNHNVARALTEFEYDASWFKLPAIVLNALKA